MKKLLVAVVLLTAGCSMVAADEETQTREKLEQEIPKLEEILKNDRDKHDRLLRKYKTYCTGPTMAKDQRHFNYEHQRRFCLARWFSNPIQQEYTDNGCSKLFDTMWEQHWNNKSTEKKLIAMREKLREQQEKNN